MTRDPLISMLILTHNNADELLLRLRPECVRAEAHILKLALLGVND